MIEKRICSWTEISERMNMSLFSVHLDLKGSTYSPPHKVIIKPTMNLFGKTVQRGLLCTRLNTTLDSSILSQDDKASERFTRIQLKYYLEDVGAIMEGKQGLIVLDFISASNPKLMALLEDVVAGVALASDVVYMLYTPTYVASSGGRSSPLHKLWCSYLDYRGITEDDWVDGFAL